MKLFGVSLSTVVLLLQAFSSPSYSQENDSPDRWEASLSYEINQLNYSFKTYHFGVTRHWGIESFNSISATVSYGLYRSVNIGAGLTVNLHSIKYDRIFFKVHLRNYEKNRMIAFYPELKAGVIRGRSVRPGNTTLFVFSSLDLIIETSIGDNVFLTIGPGFAYFPDQFTYGYWEGRYAPIVGNSVFVEDPVTVRNYLFYITFGIKYRF